VIQLDKVVRKVIKQIIEQTALGDYVLARRHPLDHPSDISECQPREGVQTSPVQQKTWRALVGPMSMPMRKMTRLLVTPHWAESADDNQTRLLSAGDG